MHNYYIIHYRRNDHVKFADFNILQKNDALKKLAYIYIYIAIVKVMHLSFDERRKFRIKLRAWQEIEFDM